MEWRLISAPYCKVDNPLTYLTREVERQRRHIVIALVTMNEVESVMKVMALKVMKSLLLATTKKTRLTNQLSRDRNRSRPVFPKRPSKAVSHLITVRLLPLCYSPTTAKAHADNPMLRCRNGSSFASPVSGSLLSSFLASAFCRRRDGTYAYINYCHVEIRFDHRHPNITCKHTICVVRTL
jgi:hypothetical protein